MNMIQLLIDNANNISFINGQNVLHETTKSHDASGDEKCRKFTKLDQLYIECSPELTFVALLHRLTKGQLR
jgi:hypothetical protein